MIQTMKQSNSMPIPNEIQLLEKSRLVHLYMQDWLPATDGTGTNNRLFSNLRAYLDLGYEVEIVCFRRKSNLDLQPIPELQNVRWTFIKPELTNGIIDRVSYVTGTNQERALNYRFKSRAAIKKEVEQRMRQDPNALHHFEYLDTACSYIDLPGCRGIWSMHDLESKFVDANGQIRSEISNGRRYTWEARAAKFLALAERKAAEQSALTLCIAKHEMEFLRDEWNCNQAEFFPMSLPDESAPGRKRDGMKNAKFSILHLGRVDSLPSYRSLEFLFTRVFPLLSEEISRKIDFSIVGELRNSPKAIRIKELASDYSFVRFLGFQKDLREQYSNADLQLVGSTDATGLRTRIIESFAYGVPVLSTTVGAEGVQGLKNGVNIVLADTAEQFSRSLERLLSEPGLRDRIAPGGRSLYDQVYSRAAVSKRLDELLLAYSLVPNRG